MDIEDIKRINVGPGDSVVVRIPYILTAQQAVGIKARIQPNLPDGVRLLVIGKDIELIVVSNDEAHNASTRLGLASSTEHHGTDEPSIVPPQWAPRVD